MDIARQIVTQLPLAELWRNDGLIPTTRIRYLSASDITDLLRDGQVQFVVADVGTPLRWIPLVECYDFWKTEVRQHLAAPEAKVILDDFPGGYCYFASAWRSRDGATPIIVCERHH